MTERRYKTAFEIAAESLLLAGRIITVLFGRATEEASSTGKVLFDRSGNKIISTITRRLF
jgi:hypothetical protein